MDNITEKKDDQLKAYSVQGDEAGAIVFATNSATARRMGANAIDHSWEEIETCRRAPWADIYAASGRVPPLEMINHGWWFECMHCGARVSHDTTHFDDDDNEIPHEPVEEGDGVYCTPACQQAEHRERAEQAARKEAATKAVTDRFPGVVVQWVDDSTPARTSFTFPGGQYAVNWTVGEDTASVRVVDVEAWHAYKATLQPQPV